MVILPAHCIRTPFTGARPEGLGELGETGFGAAELGRGEGLGKRDELPAGRRLGDLDKLRASVVEGRL